LRISEKWLRSIRLIKNKELYIHKIDQQGKEIGKNSEEKAGALVRRIK